MFHEEHLECAMRTKYEFDAKSCPRCGNESKINHSYCKDCLNQWSRNYYANLPAEMKVKVDARAKVNSAIARGKIQRQPCEMCLADKAQAHHEDYTQPFAVRWLCNECHQEHHRQDREFNRYGRCEQLTFDITE
jgi:ribosomal protein S27AE